MPQPYNLTNISSTNNLYEFMSEANVLADGLLGSLTLLVLWIILFMAFKKFETKTAFASSSFLTALIAVLLKILGWISTAYMTIPVLMAGIGFIWLVWGD